MPSEPHFNLPAADDVIDLPPVPTRLNAGPEILGRALVTVLTEDSGVQRGKLLTLSATAKKITLLNNAGQTVTYSMDDVLAVSFDEKLPLKPALVDDPVLAGEAEPLAMQPYSVKLRNGQTQSGKMFTAFQSREGLHLFAAHDGRHLSRLFFPQAAISKLRLGNKLGEALVKDGKLTEKSLALALRRQEELQLQSENSGPASRKGGTQPIKRPPRIGEVLVDMGISNNTDVQRELARQIGIPFVNLKKQELQKEALELMPRELAEKYGAIPIRLLGNTLLVAMDNPLNTEIIDMVEFITNHHIELISATHDDIHAAISTHYPGMGIGQEILDAENLQQILHLDDQQQAEITDAERLSTGRPVVRLVSKIILDAIKKNASDIHIRPREEVTDLLYRIDGVLVLVRSFSSALLAAVVGRIKIIGKMDIAERRLPQDGRAQIMESGNAVDMRISIIPTVNGESVVIRLLNTMSGLKSISELGLSEKDSDLFIDLLNKNNGVILVTGPTGSGKSTTLYAALKELISRNLNIITVENPVEYHIDGIEQIQVNTVPGYTFARALRHILRHDPDVIMVGEIRDSETGKIAVESALTGHLVLSTLHTNDAPGAITRLLEMGVDPFLINGALLGIFAQRLVRRNCQHCLREENPEPMARKALGVSPDETFFAGAGCERCNHTGYKGRLAVYEIFALSGGMRELVDRRASAQEIKAQALRDGMVPLTDNALLRAREKITSLSEVYRVRLD